MRELKAIGKNCFSDEILTLILDSESRIGYFPLTIRLLGLHKGG